MLLLILLAKALEMFLSMIVDEAHKVTKERGSRKIESYHLYAHCACALNSRCWYILRTSFSFTRKHAVERVVMLDFLKELVEGIPDPSAGGTIDVENGKEGRKRSQDIQRIAKAECRCKICFENYNKISNSCRIVGHHGWRISSKLWLYLCRWLKIRSI